MKPGDIVKLKCGGPTMVVAEKFSYSQPVICPSCNHRHQIGIDGDKDKWICHWFDTNNLLQGNTFHEVELILVELVSLDSQC